MSNYFATYPGYLVDVPDVLEGHTIVGLKAAEALVVGDKIILYKKGIAFEARITKIEKYRLFNEHTVRITYDKLDEPALSPANSPGDED